MCAVPVRHVATREKTTTSPAIKTKKGHTINVWVCLCPPPQVVKPRIFLPSFWSISTRVCARRTVNAQRAHVTSRTHRVNTRPSHCRGRHSLPLSPSILHSIYTRSHPLVPPATNQPYGRACVLHRQGATQHKAVSSGRPRRPRDRALVRLGQHTTNRGHRTRAGGKKRGETSKAAPGAKL